ncbi:hypothetical protein GDO81_013345 [Engystomops pustulosus]|uniref:RING-type E3 ubiquitin transferase n=1 Tax=Engystomops pustulosus TaxID=76066 RepID=A0AAV7B3Q3_ENGPU|nr:hypothetical protein GDO81_013345 [Engystomops pustulosus]KAG8566706.1 hypothetical protein GDO81_013345 [Engystomops pustulosus]
MDKHFVRYKSIISGHHMKDVQQKMDSEYKAHLRHQERVRENTERLREKRVAPQRTTNLLSFYSTRSYSKPWQNGMHTKTEIPAVSGLEERRNSEQPYKSTVSKLPAIKKDKDLITKKTVYNPTRIHESHKLITVSQPRITVEKKRLHVHQLSAKPSVTRVLKDIARSKNAQKLQSKAKELKRPAKHQKQMGKEKEFTQETINDYSATQQPYMEQETMLRSEGDHNFPTSSTPLYFCHLTDGSQTNRRPSSSWSHLEEPEDVLNRQPQRDNNEDHDTFDEDDLSYMSLPIHIRAQTSSTVLHTESSDCTDSSEEDNNYNGNDGQATTHREDNEMNTNNACVILHHSEISTRNNSNFRSTNLELMQTSRQILGISPIETEGTDQSQMPAENQRGTVAPMNNESVTLSRFHENSPNTNVQNGENHALPQRTFRSSGDIEMDRDRSEYSTGPNAPGPLRLRTSTTAPSISLLRENLDLVFHTLSMQRQSERRNLENTILTSQNKEAEKPKTDPEKLKKIQESILQEDSEEEGDLCRICLMGGETTENHLIAPCQCSGSLKYVHTECFKKWLLAKIKSGAELNTVRTCEMCKEKVKCEFEGFDLNEHYRKHQETQASLNPSLYLVLLLHLYQQRYEELLQLSNTRDRVSELSRRFLHLSLGRHEHTSDNEQDS